MGTESLHRDVGGIPGGLGSDCEATVHVRNAAPGGIGMSGPPGEVNHRTGGIKKGDGISATQSEAQNWIGIGIEGDMLSRLEDGACWNDLWFMVGISVNIRPSGDIRSCFTSIDQFDPVTDCIPVGFHFIDHHGLFCLCRRGHDLQRGHGDGQGYRPGEEETLIHFNYFQYHCSRRGVGGGGNSDVLGTVRGTQEP